MSGSAVAAVDPPLRIRLLGGFEVEGVAPGALGTRKARLILRRLAVALGSPVSVDELADAVWGDRLPANPSDQLSVLVSRLRGVLGADRLRRGDVGYRLVADWVDVVELEARVQEVEERLLSGRVSSAFAVSQAALGLARGRLLPEDDAIWVDDARRSADRLVARARLLAAEAALAAGDASIAQAAAAAVLDDDPYDEAALRLKLQADAAAGRPAAALAEYAVFRRRLVEELGVGPSPETERVHAAIVRGEISPVAGSTSRGWMVGRVRELRALDAALARARRGEPTAVVVEGEAGMGKSLLLRTWSARSGAVAVVMRGRGDELGRGLPLQPVIDGLSAHLRELGVARTAEVLGADMAVLGPLLGYGRESSGPVVTTVVDSDAGRLAVWGSLAAVLARAARERPLALVVDDLHRAAAGTAEFLAFALARLSRVVVVAARRPGPGPDLPQAERVTLGGLELADAVALAGPRRGPRLYERSGGHPLFLAELARAGDDELPASVVDAVKSRLTALGDAAATVEVAAVLGPVVDVDLVVAVTGQPVRAVLDALEVAADAGLLAATDAGVGFAHELLREAIEAGCAPARRLKVHRLAANALAARPDRDPLLLAAHARQAGDAALAAAALTTAASRASERFQPGAAEALLDEAVELAETPAPRLARGRLRLARLDLEGAGADAARAIELGAGAAGFELAGWVAYYGRDYDGARRYADEGAARAHDDALRASCLTLAGRVRHTRGELADAEDRLTRAAATGPPGVRGVALVWQAQLLVHRGDPAAASEVARRGLLDPHLGHPFAPLHGRFSLAFALALMGRWAEAMNAVDDLEAATVRLGDKRFPAVNANIRGWLLRGAGLVEAAGELHEQAAAMGSTPSFAEPRYAGLLDLAEDGLAAGRLDKAAAALDACAGISDWDGSMSWRHRDRYRLVTARLASIGGDHGQARARCGEVAAVAGARGDRRYECRARLIAATAAARAGNADDERGTAALVARYLPVAGPDGWRDLAELAAATRSDACWRQAEDVAARVVEEAAGRDDVDVERVGRAVRRQLDGMRWW